MSENASPPPPQDRAQEVQHVPTATATATATTTSKDRRTLELEELRKKQLAKSWQETKGDNSNGGNGGGQPPMAMESWFQKQRAQTQENRQKQIDATEHLHKYRGLQLQGLQGVESAVSISGNHVTINDMKDELKRKEQEAAALRHSYRGTPDAVLSHQVKKISKGNNNSSNDLTASASKSSFTDVVEHTSNSMHSATYEHGGIDFAKYNMEDGEPVKIPVPKETEFSNDRKQSDATAVSVSDWELLSEKGRLSTAGSVSEISSAFMVTLNSSDSCSTSENNNKVNMDTLYVVPSGDGVDSELDTESLEKSTGLSSHSSHANEPDADAAAGPNIATSTGMKEDSISTSPPVDKEEISREWVTTNVSVSFGLLVLKDDAPQLGSYNAPVECKLLENILTKMRILAKQSLDQEIKSSNIMLADSDTNPVHIHVDNDGGYKIPASRPNTQRCLIKLSIPIKYVSEDHDAKTTAQSLVCGALRRALKSRAIV